MKKKPIVLLLSCALLLGTAVGGTLAWLFTTTAPVVNTFTLGDISIHLSESEGSADPDNENQRIFKLLPGVTLAKDPKVTVEAGSKACYLFISVKETNNTVDGLTGKVINWSVAAGNDPFAEWVPVPAHEGFWYRELDAIPASAADATFTILTASPDYENGFVTINAGLTRDMVQTVSNAAPVLTFNAAAVQKTAIDSVADAWAILPAEFIG